MEVMELLARMMECSRVARDRGSIEVSRASLRTDEERRGDGKGREVDELELEG